MHGRLKVRTTAEQQAIKAKERARKLTVYRAAIDRVFTKRKAGELDDEILQISGQILSENPDIYTLWNIRKEALSLLKEKNSEIVEYIGKELTLTEQCIRVNPKSYNSWFHRSWVLDLSPNVDFLKEFGLCDKCLELDDRNFHCWDYRRALVAKSKASLDNELNFSTRIITKNFSNYSSWHYRSELLPRVYPSSSCTTLLDEKKLEEECKLIQNAIFTDPNDQSAWFYQRWLLFNGEERKANEEKRGWLSTLNAELESCQQLYDLEPNNKWVILQICELLRHINCSQHEPEILQFIEKLSQVDPLRKGFYTDLGLKIMMDNQKKTAA